MNVTEIRRRSVTVLAWTTFVLAIATGALTATTNLGLFVSELLRSFPWPWLPTVLLVVAVITTVIDVFNDGQPNQAAVFSVMAMPSLAISTSGNLAHHVTGWSRSVLAMLSPAMSDWLGTTSSTGLAVAGVVGVILMSNRVVKKAHGRPPGDAGLDGPIRRRRIGVR